MTQCIRCTELAANPHRADIPAHFKRFVVRDRIFGLKKIQAFECRDCETIWRWDANESWICIATLTHKRPSEIRSLAVETKAPPTKASCNGELVPGSAEGRDRALSLHQ